MRKDGEPDRWAGHHAVRAVAPEYGVPRALPSEPTGSPRRRTAGAGPCPRPAVPAGTGAAVPPAKGVAHGPARPTRTRAVDAGHRAPLPGAAPRARGVPVPRPTAHAPQVATGASRPAAGRASARPRAALRKGWPSVFYLWRNVSGAAAGFRPGGTSVRSARPPSAEPVRHNSYFRPTSQASEGAPVAQWLCDRRGPVPARSPRAARETRCPGGVGAQRALPSVAAAWNAS